MASRIMRNYVIVSGNGTSPADIKIINASTRYRIRQICRFIGGSAYRVGVIVTQSKSLPGLFTIDAKFSENYQTNGCT